MYVLAQTRIIVYLALINFGNFKVIYGFPVSGHPFLHSAIDFGGLNKKFKKRDRVRVSEERDSRAPDLKWKS
jgi:hypothetical protein